MKLTSLLFFAIFSLTLAFLHPQKVWAKAEASGRITLMGDYFPKDAPNPPTDLQGNGGKIEIEPIAQFSSEDWRFRLKALGGYDFSYKNSRDQIIAIPQEMFGETRAGAWNILVGINTFNWGITDIVNPLDVVNPRSFRNPLMPVKYGSPAISASWSGDSTSFELVYIPKQIYHEMPRASSRYLPRDQTIADFTVQQGNNTYQIQGNSNPWNFTYDKPVEFDNPMDSNFALRIRQTIGKLEIHLVGFEGIPSFPELKTRPEFNIVSLSPYVLSMGQDVNLVPHYARVRTAGIGAVYSWDTLILRLAAAQTWRTTNKDIMFAVDSGPTTEVYITAPQTAVIGLEKTFSWQKLDWTVLLQAASEKDLSGAPENPYGLTTVFDGAVMPGLRIASGLDFSMTLGGIVNPKTKSQIALIDSNYRLTDHWQFKLGGQYIAGGDNKLLKSIESAAMIEGGVNYFW